MINGGAINCDSQGRDGIDMSSVHVSGVVDYWTWSVRRYVYLLTCSEQDYCEQDCNYLFHFDSFVSLFYSIGPGFGRLTYGVPDTLKFGSLSPKQEIVEPDANVEIVDLLGPFFQVRPECGRSPD